nr:hypothetical protein [Tanacetum cinerariifolium]
MEVGGNDIKVVKCYENYLETVGVIHNFFEAVGYFLGWAEYYSNLCSKPGLQSMTSGQISSGLNLTYAPSTITTQQPSEGKLDLLFEAMYDDYIGGQQSA